MVKSHIAGHVRWDTVYWRNGELKKEKIRFCSRIIPLGGFPGGSDGKETACNAGDAGSVSGLRRSPGEENGNPLQYPCLEKPGGYCPRGCKESDTAEQLTHTHTHIHILLGKKRHCLTNIIR